MTEQLITDNNKNLNLYQNHINLFLEYTKRRKNRQYASYIDYVKAEFPNGVKPSLAELNQLINEYEKLKTLYPTETSLYDPKIAYIQNKIDNNDYVAEDSPEWANKLAYEARKAAFVWPTQEELDTRAQEEQELLAYLEQNT